MIIEGWFREFGVLMGIGGTHGEMGVLMLVVHL